MPKQLNFTYGTLRYDVYHYVITRKEVTQEELFKKFPKENQNTLRGIMSLLKTAGLVKDLNVWRVLK